MTGAGRSTAAKELEDLGFFVVDNLPPQLVADVVRLVDETRGPLQPIGGRGRRPLRVVLHRPPGGARPGQHRHGAPTLLFLEANDEVLVRRQETVRRPHPLQDGGRLVDGMRRERRRAGRPARPSRPGDRHQRPQRAPADRQGGRGVRHRGAPPRSRPPWSASASSTASPSTPTWWSTCGSCRTRTGCPSCGRSPGRPATSPTTCWAGRRRRRSSSSTSRCSRPSATGYLREGKRFMTIAIGCTGGKHRSVAMTEEIAARLRERRARRAAGAPGPRP